MQQHHHNRHPQQQLVLLAPSNAEQQPQPALPDQVIFRLFALLGQRERSVMLRVCKQFNRVGNLPTFWRIAQSSTADDQLIAHLCHRRPWIEQLRLGYSRRLTPSSIVNIASRLQNLTVLDVEGTLLQLDAPALQALQRCSHLRQLNVGSCRIPDVRLFGAFSGMPSLRALSLGGVASVDDEALKHLFPPPESPDQRPLRLQQLILAGCANISDAGLALVAARLAMELRLLSLAYCHRLTDKSIVFLSMRCGNMASLNLYGCASLTDASLQAIGSRLVLLEHLDLSLCSRLTDQGILSLVSSNPGGPQRPPGLARLRELKLYNCVEITDAGIQAIAVHCPNLRNLSLFGLEKVSPAAVVGLMARVPGLRKLDIGGCPMIDGGFLQQCTRRYPHIDFC